MNRPDDLSTYCNALNLLQQTQSTSFEHMQALIYRGSIAHGTWRPPRAVGYDDIDFAMIYAPPLRYYLDPSLTNRAGTRQIIRDDLDIVLYEWTKFFRLLMGSNPNVIFLLWTDPDFVHYRTPVWDKVVQNRDIFLSKKLYYALRGYAMDQTHRMKESKDTGSIGVQRKKLIQTYGYDTKAAAHAVRLLRIGVEFLRTDTFQILRPDAAELLQIKDGLWTKERVLNEIQVLECQLTQAMSKSTLPERVNQAKIAQLCADTLVEVNDGCI